MQPLKILLLTAVWGRQEITKLQIQNVRRLVDFDPARFAITPVYIVSEFWAVEMCQMLGIRFVWQENKFLGRKMNNGLKAFLHLDFDWLMVTGSDDFVEPEILNEYLPHFERHPAFGLNTVYAVEESTGNQREMQIGYAFGAMRCIRWDLIQQTCGNLWNDNDNRGLDYGSMLNLKSKTGADIQVVYVENKVWDVKGMGNINPYSQFGTSEVDGLPLPLEIKHLEKNKETL